MIVLLQVRDLDTEFAFLMRIRIQGENLKGILVGSVSDPDWLNLDLDPDPANLVNLDSDLDLGLKKLFKNKSPQNWI